MSDRRLSVAVWGVLVYTLALSVGIVTGLSNTLAVASAAFAVIVYLTLEAFA